MWTMQGGGVGTDNHQLDFDPQILGYIDYPLRTFQQLVAISPQGRFEDSALSCNPRMRLSVRNLLGRYQGLWIGYGIRGLLSEL